MSPLQEVLGWSALGADAAVGDAAGLRLQLGPSAAPGQDRSCLHLRSARALMVKTPRKRPASASIVRASVARSAGCGMPCPDEAGVFACIAAAWHTWPGVVIGCLPGHEAPELGGTVSHTTTARACWFLGHRLPRATCTTVQADHEGSLHGMHGERSSHPSAFCINHRKEDCECPADWKGRRNGAKLSEVLQEQ